MHAVPNERFGDEQAALESLADSVASVGGDDGDDGDDRLEEGDEAVECNELEDDAGDMEGNSDDAFSGTTLGSGDTLRSESSAPQQPRRRVKAVAGRRRALQLESESKV